MTTTAVKKNTVQKIQEDFLVGIVYIMNIKAGNNIFSLG
jgi:hypothetical protein